MNIEDLGDDELDLFPESEMIALVDADTVAFAAACTSEHMEQILPREMYSDEEWEALINSEGYWEADGGVWHTDTDMAINKAIEDVYSLMMETNCGSTELYFSTGRNFRYDVYPMYKANRLKDRYPSSLMVIKLALLEKFPGMICKEFEADDKVVQLKQRHPEKYVLCAVDKDVYNSVAGKHYNYYKSALYNIKRKWMDIDHEHAFTWPYKQCLMGDTSDNVPGCPSIGKVKAAKAMENCHTPCDMWKAVVGLFKKAKLPITDAIRDMRLVHMHQLDTEDNVVLWNPPCPIEEK